MRDAERAALIGAIHRGRLPAAARDLLDDPRTSPAGRAAAETALATTAAIGDRSRAEQARLVDALDRLGLDVTADGDPGPSATVHSFALRVGAPDASAAIAACAAEGYRWYGPSHPAAWAALHRRGEIVLVRTDRDTTRLTLRWRGSPGGRLAPSDADLDAVRLPAASWRAYHLIRPARVAWRRARRRPAAHHGPYVGTPDELIPALLDLASVGPDDRLVDIGCGDGRIVVTAATRHGCRAVGIEQDRRLAEAGQARATAAGVADLVEIVHGDALDADLASATVVFSFLPRDLLSTILPAVRDGLAAGSRIVAHEQLALDPALAPDESVPLFGPASVTVAHLWRT